MKVLELKGYDSLAALNVYSTLLVGLKMLPEYKSEDYESFLSRVQELEPPALEALFRKGAMIVKLERDEVESIVTFVADPNGLPSKKAYLKTLSPDQIIDMIVAVCMEISKFEIKLISDAEKKN